MDVDIDTIWRQIDVKDSARITAFHDKRVVGVTNGEENGIRHGSSSVDDGPLVTPRNTRKAWLADETTNGNAVLLVVYRQHRFIDILSEQHENSRAEIACGGGADDFAVVENK